MAPRPDVSGQRFGRLVVLSMVPSAANTVIKCSCRCDCRRWLHGDSTLFGHDHPQRHCRGAGDEGREPPFPQGKAWRFSTGR